jgi:hypothetical protein
MCKTRPMFQLEHSVSFLEGKRSLRRKILRMFQSEHSIDVEKFCRVFRLEHNDIMFRLEHNVIVFQPEHIVLMFQLEHYGVFRLGRLGDSWIGCRSLNQQ